MSKLTEKPLRKIRQLRSKKEQYVSPDGKARAPATERQINEAFAVSFRGASGAFVRNYLRSITTNKVMPPGTPPDTINYFEGARWLMGIIDTRIKDGEEKKP